MQAVAFDDDGYQPRPYPPRQGGAPPSMISGVGEGYGRRNNGPPGLPVSLTPESSYSNLPPPAPSGTPNNAGRGTGTGSRLAADARMQRGYAPGPTTEAFQGMYEPQQSTSPPPMSNQGHYPSSSAYDHQQNSSPLSANPSMPLPMPVPQPSFNGPREPQQYQQQQPVSPTYQGGYPSYVPPPPPSALTPGGGAIGGAVISNQGHEKPYSTDQYQQQYTSSTSPPPQQTFYVQNPSPSTHQPDSSVYSSGGGDQHYQSQGLSQGLNPNTAGGGGGQIDRAPSTHAPTYYTYEDPYAQNQQQQQGGSINYHGGAGGSSTDHYGYNQNRY